MQKHKRVERIAISRKRAMRCAILRWIIQHVGNRIYIVSDAKTKRRRCDRNEFVTERREGQVDTYICVRTMQAYNCDAIAIWSV